MPKRAGNVDATVFISCPGAIDVHVHFARPANAHRRIGQNRHRAAAAMRRWSRHGPYSRAERRSRPRPRDACAETGVAKKRRNVDYGLYAGVLAEDNIDHWRRCDRGEALQNSHASCNTFGNLPSP